MNLKGKAAIVTGGAKGIGYGIAYRLAEAGASVLVADIDDGAAKEAAAGLSAMGRKAVPLKVDVSSEADVAHMVDFCRRELGSVDILVNNAGIYPPAPLAAMTEEQFERVVHVNLRSVFLTTKYASEAMKQAGKGGRIINITSIDAIHPSMVGLAHYDASKHGVWGFTQNVALELAPHNIWVNAVAPGGIATPGVQAMQAAAPAQNAETLQRQTEAFLSKIPMRRMGDADEIGKVVLFLATDLASYMTGAHIVVDGGALLG
jgi:2-deoxy-D-gluconate 3-dehydrogenase